jgi:uncharacterized protein YciI
MTRTRRAAALALAVALTAPPALAQAPAAPRALYLFVYRPGPAWLAGKPVSAQPLAPHGAYMKQLTDQGHLLAGGPWTDVEGGLAIVRAASADEARALLAADPAVSAGVMAADLRTWTPYFNAAKLTP